MSLWCNQDPSLPESAPSNEPETPTIPLQPKPPVTGAPPPLKPKPPTTACQIPNASGGLPNWVKTVGGSAAVVGVVGCALAEPCGAIVGGAVLGGAALAF